MSSNQDKLKLDIINQSDNIAKCLSKGKDVELRKDVNGVRVIEVEKKVVKK